MNEIFNIGISRRDGSLRSVNLTLPATQYQLIDALEQLRVVSAEKVQTEIYYCHSSTTLNLLPTASGDLYEVNALAEKMAGFEDWQKEAFDGMLKVDAFESSEPIPISKLIDFAYSTECCHIVGGVTTDQELGKFLVDNDLWGDGEALPDEAYKSLDYKAIGREHRLDEGGTFTANAYVEQHSDLIEAHQAVDSKPSTPDYTILLEVRNNSQNSNEAAVPLKLPAIESELDDTLEQFDTATWKEIGFRCLDCKAPMLTDLINDAADISEINQLAEMLAEMPQKQLTEYKAILTATRCSEFDSAVQLLDSMEDYIVTPAYETMEDVARDELNVIMPTESIGLMLPYLDLDGYGQALVRELNADLTAYGMVERKDRQPVYESQPQSRDLQMM